MSIAVELRQGGHGDFWLEYRSKGLNLPGDHEKAGTLLFSSGAGRNVKGLEEDASSALLAFGASATTPFPLALGPFPLPPAVDAGAGSAAAAEAAAALS